MRTNPDQTMGRARGEEEEKVALTLHVNILSWRLVVLRRLVELLIAFADIVDIGDRNDEGLGRAIHLLG